MTTCSTHVLDSARGLPAAELGVLLSGPGTHETAATDADGRVRFTAELEAGTHELRFDTGPWFTAAGHPCFYPEVAIAFDVEAAQPHLHVALLLAAYSYTTYRGS